MIKRSDVARHWATAPPPWPGFWLDWGEPACFSCGGFSSLADQSAPNTWSRWDAATYLERAHIVPRALGGDDTAGNMLLLCAHCHAEAPDTADPRDMFEFCQRSPNAWRVDTPRSPMTFADAARLFGVTADAMSGLLSADTDSRNEWLSTYVGTHGSAIGAATMACACRAFAAANPT